MSITEFFRPLNTKFNHKFLTALVIASLSVAYAPFAPSFPVAMAVIISWYAIVIVTFCITEHLTNKNKPNE